MPNPLLLFELLVVSSIIAMLLTFDHSRIFFKPAVKPRSKQRTELFFRIDAALVAFILPIAASYFAGVTAGLALVVLELIVVSVAYGQRARAKRSKK